MGLFIMIGVYLVDVRVGYVGDVDHYLFWSWVLIGFAPLRIAFLSLVPKWFLPFTLAYITSFKDLPTFVHRIVWMWKCCLSMQVMIWHISSRLVGWAFIVLNTWECELGGQCSQIKGLVGERSSTSFTHHINESWVCEH